jgi:AbrB family looped-hinge helix DNA binding protein
MAATAPVVEFLASTTIGEKGQLTVPKNFRDELHLKAGAPVAILRIGNGLILIPEEERFERLCEQISDALLSAGITVESAVESLPQIRRQLYEEHYGEVQVGRKLARRPQARRTR